MNSNEKEKLRIDGVEVNGDVEFQAPNTEQRRQVPDKLVSAAKKRIADRLQQGKTTKTYHAQWIR